MIKRSYGNLKVLDTPVPAASMQLEREGYAHIKGVLTPDEVAALAAEMTAVFESSEADRPHDVRSEFRHGMFNRSPLSQKAIASRALLDVIEPLIGEDCHVIANTAWRNVAGHEGGRWHIDAGPHVPRPEGVEWPEAIPYPVFVIGVHIFVEDCPLEAGPTAVIPGSHRSGQFPPRGDRALDLNLSYRNQSPVLLPAKAGDAILFVSDVWHRGTPAKEGQRRFFLQCHYGRRDIQQRIFPTAEVSHVLPEAAGRATTERERQLIGLHNMFFYDA
jgi:ectoine hydroxylase-related dioxygenase (phytanoyl-CoA dioxygenase family)